MERDSKRKKTRSSSRPNFIKIGHVFLEVGHISSARIYPPNLTLKNGVPLREKYQIHVVTTGLDPDNEGSITYIFTGEEAEKLSELLEQLVSHEI